MTHDKQKPTAWRCRTVRQQKDKAAIYNSREWHDLRIRKLQANPLCEQCQADGEAQGIRGGFIRSATAVHHRHPIEDSTTFEEMRRWAFDWNNLMSVCQECHARIHKEMRSNTKAVVKERREKRLDRWRDQMINRFTNNGHQDTTGAATVDAPSED